jgi:ABC-type nitrate/sulfonate/bicarbonate transport system permease component
MAAALSVAFVPAGPRLRRGLRGIAGVLALLTLWQASVKLVGLPSYFYPAPIDVARALADLVRKGILPAYLADSLARYAAGVACGTVIGVTLGVAIGLSRTVSRLLGPMLNFFYAIVEVAWIPIFVIWWGYGIKAILVALTYVVAFPMLFNTSVGVRAAPPVLINAVRSLGGSWTQVMREVILPAALPGIITGFRVGAGFAFRGLIFAEMIAAKTGIGYLIISSATNHATDRTVVGMIVMGALWLLIDNVYLKPFERATVERWGTVNVAEERA